MRRKNDDFTVNANQGVASLPFSFLLYVKQIQLSLVAVGTAYDVFFAQSSMLCSSLQCSTRSTCIFDVKSQ